ncbi:MAG TPA: FtsX-like permease family protein [Steroidobacteraceae bacterium]|nr:FtsX-like permease family protein [Steroidobacteraceae bacterium]
MRTLAQILVLSRLGFAGLFQRKWSSLVLAGSVACVVGVLLSMLAVTAGMLRAYRAGEDPQLAMVLSPSNEDYGSGIPRDAVGTILSAPGIAIDADGHLLADAEVVFWVPPSKAYVVGSPTLRGIGDAGLKLRPNFRVVGGRQFSTGLQELIIGVSAARVYDLHVGDKVILPNGTWPIVGTFSDAGSVLESQLVGDAPTLMSAGHVNGYSSVLVRLNGPQAFDAFARWLTSNPALKVNPERQSDYALRTVHRASAFFSALTYVVSVTMGLGAFFGVVKLTYTAVSVRTREIATLRALGYQPLPVAVSVLLESVVVCVAGALVGASLAWLLFNGKLVAALQSVFTLSVSPRLFTLGIVWGLVLAVLGGLLPAIRAARLPVATALRAQ